MYNGNDHGGSTSKPKPETKPQAEPKEAPGQPRPPHEEGKKIGK